MKKIYLTITMLAMMVAALSFAACSSDDDNDGDRGSAQKTFIIDGESYYAGRPWARGAVEQSRYGMYLEICAVENIHFPVNGHILTLHISPTKVSELSDGQIFTYGEFGVHTFQRLTEITVDSNWDVLSGEMIIKNIKATELTLQINNLTIESGKGAVRKIEGTATLYNSVYDSNNNLLPFSETEP